MAKRYSVFVFGLLAYLVFLFTVLCGIGFVGDLSILKNVDGGASTGLGSAIAIDFCLIVLFGLQHSVMARPAFKKRWFRLIPKPAERSAYVLFASLSLLLLFWQWRPLPVAVWALPKGLPDLALEDLFWVGWLGVVLSTFLISHFDLFGLRQVYLYLRNIPYTPIPFKEPIPYRYVRHPLMLAFLIAFWATPHMTEGHLLFASDMTMVIFIGIAFEERGLLAAYGESYAQYRRQVSMIFPLPRRKQ